MISLAFFKLDFAKKQPSRIEATTVCVMAKHASNMS